MMKFWWSKSPSPGNFGDILTPYILDYFDIKHRYVSHPKKAEMLCIGSIAKFARKNTIVLGSGTMRRSDRLDPRADWQLVRGPHTRDIVISHGGSCPAMYGDPALLMPLITGPIEQTDKIGIVPHYVDYEYVINTYYGRKVINVLNPDPLDCVRQIGECDKIISSSLHGIIIAHAYGIPAAWVRFSNKLSGDDVKFADYFDSISADWTVSEEDRVRYIDPPSESVIDPIIEVFNKVAGK